MDQIKIGKFISNLRKSKNLTQKELADKLNVTTQAISKWENGRGIPDITFLKLLSEEFDVDITSIINGEKKVKKNKYLKYIILGVSVLFIIFLILILNNKSTFSFLNISSNNNMFNINGVAALSKDKQALYISSITSNDLKDEYVMAECSLYEVDNNVETKISQCGNINNHYNKDNATTLSELLKNVQFNIDGNHNTCNNLLKNDLYLVVNVLDINDKVISYKVKLNLTNDCK